MTNTLAPNTFSLNAINFAQLDKQYPGIRRIKRKLTNICVKKLNVLAQLIKYNVPRAYYQPEILQLDEAIQQLYFQQISREGQNMEQYDDLPAEMIRKCSPISDQDQADYMIQAQTTLVRPFQRYSINDIRQFIQNFNPMTDAEKANQNLKQSLSQFSKTRKEQCKFQNYKLQQKEKDKDRQKIKNYNSLKSMKSQQSNQDSSKKYNKQIIITMGDKIPLQVKEMRNCVKKNSLDSFAISSHKIYESKTDREKQKILISLSLNKVAKDNLHGIYEDIEQLIKQSSQLAKYFIAQILNKCQNQPKMADMYIQFACLFTKISTNKIIWSWDQTQSEQKAKSNLNSIHRILVQQLQHLFKKSVINNQKSKNLKTITFIIGSLIKKRKVSRRVYIEASNKIISQILNINCENLQQIQENYFEALIRLIQSLNSVYDDNWGCKSINELLNQQNSLKLTKLIQLKQISSMEQLLLELVDSFNFSTSRIKCLVQNLFSRKESIMTPTNKTQCQNKSKEIPLPSQIIHQLLSQNKIQQLIEKYQQQKSSENLSKILLAMFNGNHQQVQNNTQIFLKSFIPIIKVQQFQNFWQQNYLIFVLEQCDLPFMVESLSAIFKAYFDKDAMRCIIEPEEDNQDGEDINHFMIKLTKYL